jgi:hypothetical protein
MMTSVLAKRKVHVRVQDDIKEVYTGDFKTTDTVGMVEDAVSKSMSRRVRFMTLHGWPRVLHFKPEPLYSVGLPVLNPGSSFHEDITLFLRCFDDPEAPVAETPVAEPLVAEAPVTEAPVVEPPVEPVPPVPPVPPVHRVLQTHAAANVIMEVRQFVLRV